MNAVDPTETVSREDAPVRVETWLPLSLREYMDREAKRRLTTRGGLIRDLCRAYKERQETRLA